mgnify:CR=1 FL=1
MSNEQRAHDLTMLYIQTINQYKSSTDTNELEINFLDDYLHYYPIVLEQLNESLPNS